MHVPQTPKPSRVLKWEKSIRSSPNPKSARESNKLRILLREMFSSCEPLHINAQRFTSKHIALIAHGSPHVNVWRRIEVHPRPPKGETWALQSQTVNCLLRRMTSRKGSFHYPFDPVWLTFLSLTFGKFHKPKSLKSKQKHPASTDKFRPQLCK